MPHLLLTAPIAGFYLPEPTLAFVWAIFVFRIVYSIGYSKHPTKRIFGGAPVILCSMGLYICSFISAAKMIIRHNEITNPVAAS